MVNAGTIAGTFINAFAINEGAIVHALSGTMTMGVSGTLDATRRAAINDTMAIGFVGDVDPHRRVTATGTATIVFSTLANISQRHAARAKGIVVFKSGAIAIRRRSAGGLGVIRLAGKNDLHARRAAVATGQIVLTQSKARIVRRQRAIGSGLIRFMSTVNLRSFSPISGKDVMKFKGNCHGRPSRRAPGFRANPLRWESHGHGTPPDFRRRFNRLSVVDTHAPCAHDAHRRNTSDARTRRSAMAGCSRSTRTAECPS